MLFLGVFFESVGIVVTVIVIPYAVVGVFGIGRSMVRKFRR
jgi:hypothetical protein